VFSGMPAGQWRLAQIDAALITSGLDMASGTPVLIYM